MAGWRSMSSSAEMVLALLQSQNPECTLVLLGSQQSCARAGCGASLRRSHCVSTSLRCSFSRPHLGTRCVRFALSVQTTAMRMMTKCAARTAMKAPLLGVAEAHRNPPERSFAGGLLVFGAIASANATSSRQAVPGGGDFCGGEERSFGVGARSALRKLTRCGCLNGESEANAVSSAARPQSEHRSGVDTKCDRHSMSSRRIPPAATRAFPLEMVRPQTRTAESQLDLM